MIARLVGFAEVKEEEWSPTRETTRWIGKPWRRLELLTIRHYYRGEEVDRSRHLSAHLGLRPVGLALTISIDRQSVLDYSEEPNL